MCVLCEFPKENMNTVSYMGLISRQEPLVSGSTVILSPPPTPATAKIFLTGLNYNIEQDEALVKGQEKTDRMMLATRWVR